MLASALMVGLLGAASARADGPDGGGPRREPPQQHQQQNGARAEAPRGDARPLDPRSYEARAEEQRRAMQEASRNAEMSRRVGRMTPDERRDLRRQINEVSQDLYAVPPRR
ncbi:hypothetical protein FHW58_000402 [Duganella sp. 1224]|uniref:hypothetical protein n=1 Tax=Duganella sp. 1224 TaxID=2587052 RepID=UPI00182B732A|nr:hypothetical protein [Duganella sp. 1224]NYE59250.1 hypothetical protein [Duganella sp. 1224]